MKVEGFRDLIAWQKAMDLVVDCYRLSKKFPADERYGLTAQLQRAAVSVPSNIAEGKGRGFTKSYVYHLTVANGSLCELSTQLEIAHRLNYVEITDIHAILQRIDEVGRLVTALRKSIQTALD
jgi:four helix bundle protein